MLFDTQALFKKGLITLALLATPVIANAQQKFPFEVTRNASGAVTRIELPLRTSILSASDEDVLGDLRSSLKDYQEAGLSVEAVDAIQPTTKDDKKIYAQAKAILKDSKSADAVNDPRLDKMYVKAKSQILQVKLYRLLAAPTNIDAFDRERAITEVVQALLSEAGDMLGIASPAYTVFGFLVDRYVDALESRRDFFQNQLLVLLDNGDGASLFTESEKSAIRSSVFYSRLDFYDLPARSDARKGWNLYGDKELAKAVKPCKGYASASETHWGSCFKQSGSLIYNRMVGKMTFSKEPSLAYDIKNPDRVRNFRYALMLAHLGVKFLPLPSLAKKPLTIWIGSQYREQRASEGFFFAHALLKGQLDLSNEILDSSANPIIRN